MSHIKLQVSKEQEASAKNSLAMGDETYIMEASEGEGLALEFFNEIVLFSIKISNKAVTISQDEDSLTQKLFLIHGDDKKQFTEITVSEGDHFSLTLNKNGQNSAWDIKVLEIS